jgi:hypothetical protein
MSPATEDHGNSDAARYCTDAEWQERAGYVCLVARPAIRRIPACEEAP